jgi:hypothetical protein
MIDLAIQVEIEVKKREKSCKLPYFRFTTRQKWQIMEIKFIARCKTNWESTNSHVEGHMTITRTTECIASPLRLSAQSKHCNKFKIKPISLA